MGSHLERLLSAEGSAASTSSSRSVGSNRQQQQQPGVLVPASPVKKRTTGSLNPLDFTRPSSDRRHALKNGRVVETRPPIKKEVANYFIPPSQRPSALSARLGEHRSKSAQTARIEMARSTTFRGPAAPAVAAATALSSGSQGGSGTKGKGRETGRGSTNDDDRLLAELDVGSDEHQQHTATTTVKRNDENLRLVETLEMGPVDHGLGPEGDGKWTSIEPNSQIRLSERTLAHEMLQEHLSDRFYVPPSLLYSIVDPSRDGTAFTVPLDGDWVTIAVVAEQLGSVRSTKGGPAMGKEEDEESGDEMSAGGGGTGPNMNDGHGKPSQTAGKKKKWTPKSQKKFVTFRLVALPPRSSGKSATSGDATVNLILFEADSVADVKGGETRAGGSSKRRVYKGGSGGAFETFWNVKVGTVLAILNPRVLRPLKNAQWPHPLTNALALNPVSAETVTVIGQARDMGRCTAYKADGNRCSSWVDTRNGETCDFHIHQLHKKLRSGRAEFASSTSSFQVGYKPSGSKTTGGSGHGRYIGTGGGGSGSAKKDEVFNPKEKWGLLPRDTREARQPTYVDGRHVVRDPSASAGFEFVGEKLGRSQHDKLKRKREAKEADEKILALLDKDGGSTQGGKLLELARRQQRAEEREKAIERQAAGGGSSSMTKRKGKGIEATYEGSVDEDEAAADRVKVRKRSAFRPEHVKAIGFDPSMLATGAIRAEETAEEKQERLRAISLLVKKEGADEEKLDLRPIAGRKGGWSSVKVPEGCDSKPAATAATIKPEKFIDLDSDDDQ